MLYVLDWRVRADAIGSAIVSHVRVFRSVAALKAFVGSRQFRQSGQTELRLSVRPGPPSAVFSSVAALLAWDPRDTPLPPPLRTSGWEAELTRLALRQRILATVAAATSEAVAANLLSRAQAHAVVALLRAGLSDPSVGQR